MGKVIYTVSTSAVVALVGGAAKTILGVNSGASFGINLRQVEIGFDGVTPSALPVYVELCAATFATNPPGTNSTSETPQQEVGRTIAHGTTAARSWSAEPTVLTMVEDWLIDPNKGLFIFEWPREESPDSPVSNGFAIRCNAPANVNARASFKWERA